jgi:hypothetical protein
MVMLPRSRLQASARAPLSDLGLVRFAMVRFARS